MKKKFFWSSFRYFYFTNWQGRLHCWHEQRRIHTKNWKNAKWLRIYHCLKIPHSYTQNTMKFINLFINFINKYSITYYLLDNVIPILTFHLPFIFKYVNDIIFSVPSNCCLVTLDLFNSFNIKLVLKPTQKNKKSNTVIATKNRVLHICDECFKQKKIKKTVLIFFLNNSFIMCFSRIGMPLY